MAPKSQALERTTSEIEPKAKITPKAEVKESLTEEESGKIIETAIHKQLKKPTGELTKTDLEKVTFLYLNDNPDLTKAQIAELQRALPKCKILSKHTNPIP